MNQKNTLGQRLSVIALTSGKTQTQIAQNIGMPVSKLNRFFNGHSQLNSDNLILVLRELGIELESIIESRVKSNARIGSVEIDSRADCLKFLFEQLDSVGQQIFLSSVADDVKRSRKIIFPRSLQLTLEKELNLI